MLTSSQINGIEAKAIDILAGVYGGTEKVALPVAVEKILDTYNLKLQVGTFEDTSISGIFDRDKKTIYVSDDEAANRQVFTVAHELGHYFLHDEKDADIFYRNQILNIADEKSEDEKEANWFAASLLMPRKELQHYFSLTKRLEDLSRIFGVSATAVYYRLKNLKLMA